MFESVTCAKRTLTAPFCVNLDPNSSFNAEAILFAKATRMTITVIRLNQIHSY